MIAPLGVMAVTAGFLAVGLPAAQATNDGAQPGTPAVFGEWKWSSFTEWQPTTNQPADPDSQDGEANPLNLVKIGEGGPGQWPGVYEQQVEGGQTTETSGWVRTRPAGEGWMQLPGADGEKWVEDHAAYNETVVDHAAYDETVVDSVAVNQWYHWNGGHQAGRSFAAAGRRLEHRQR